MQIAQPSLSTWALMQTSKTPIIYRDQVLIITYLLRTIITPSIAARLAWARSRMILAEFLQCQTRRTMVLKNTSFWRSRSTRLRSSTRIALSLRLILRFNLSLTTEYAKLKQSRIITSQCLMRPSASWSRRTNLRTVASSIPTGSSAIQKRTMMPTT